MKISNIMVLAAAAAAASVNAWAADGEGGAKGLPTEKWAAVIPAEKNLPPAWEKSLFERGEPRRYEGDALMKIGMPVGGVCTGLVYLGGDGRLWWWDIFNRNLNGVQPRQIQYKGRSWHGLPAGLGAWQGGNYIEPVTSQPSPFQQGFAARITVGDNVQVRTLDRKGWKNVSFTGTYPVGTVTYSDPDCPVSIMLEAYTPYCPLDFDNSSYPATIMRYSVKNAGKEKAVVDVGGWLENAVLLDTGKGCPEILRSNTFTSKPGIAMLSCSVGLPPAEASLRPAIDFEDFEKDTYEGWVAEGTAFGKGPTAKKDVPGYQGDLGMHGSHTVNSHASAIIADAPGRTDASDSVARDQATGKLVSREFKIERTLISFLIGGGNQPNRCCINLVMDGKIVRSATGHNGNQMRVTSFDVRDLEGKTAHLEIVDDMSVGWSNIGVDNIVFTDGGAVTLPTKNPDYGSMSLAAIGTTVCNGSAQLKDASAGGLFGISGPGSASAPANKPLIGGVTQSLTLAPGKTGQTAFVITWHFVNVPNIANGSVTGWYYGRRFANAAAVAEHIAANETRLSDVTMSWRDTWYDSTLPYWFLDRTFISLDCLAATTCFRFGDGRFYTFEGVRSCEGHPNHVWHYAQGHARIFPELEQDVLERVWYGFGFHNDGSLAYRGEKSAQSAIDGHCGTILSVLRAHQTNPDSKMLKRIWPKVKLSILYAIKCDRDNDGLLDTPMLTTLDEPWHGQIPWISSLYIAALKAGEQMATEMGDTEFADDCRNRAAKGRAAMDAKLFNGEWFIQIPDPLNPKKLGAYETCHIDQVLGQAWAWQVGMGRILNEDTTRSALRSIWKYNFSRNLDAYDKQADPKGRPYYADGEGGLVMTANALGRKIPFGVYSGFACYLNETMNGFEYQAAAHMIAEGMVKEGFAVIRTVDERYDGNKRNPFDEVECGDHYARSMASYGALIAVSGFEYHGPNGYIGFSPRLTPDNFRAPFTAAEGWGTFSQKRDAGGMNAALAVKHGSLRITTVRLTLPDGIKAGNVKVKTGTWSSPGATITQEGARVLVTLTKPLVIKAGETCTINIKGQ